MSTEERWESLLKASKVVLKVFREGHYPSFKQLERLDSAIDSVQAERICGHRFIEDCDCDLNSCHHQNVTRGFCDDCGGGTYV